MPSLKLSIVVPCFNEAEGLAELHRRVSAVCNEVVDEAYELILINDGSTDDTWRHMEALCSQDKQVVALNLSRNHGHQLALSAGLKMCCGDRILILDADLQDPPELLPKMMACLDAGCDVAYGQRTSRDGETWFKKTSASAFYRVLGKMIEIEIPPDTGDFRLMTRRALDVLNEMPEHHRFIRGMVSWIGLRQEAIPYAREARFAGETKYPLSKMIRFALDAVTGFSIGPLRLASYLGFYFGIATLILLAYVLFAYFLGRTVEGWTSLAVIVLALGSVQLFVTGVMGEYLGRLYIEAKRRPLYVIQEVVCSHERFSSKKPLRSELESP
jgi:polyisoprenyl-phosphate glycosyltransferase